MTPPKTFYQCGECGSDVDLTRVGTPDEDRHRCVDNLRALLRHYRDHVIETNGTDFLDDASSDRRARGIRLTEAEFIRTL